jgi:hypothetical protein
LASNKISPIEQTFAESPSFVRQEIVDPANDWIFWNVPTSKSIVNTQNGYSIAIDNAKNASECKIQNNGISSNNGFSIPDIESVSYISDGKTLNASMWLTSAFNEPPVNYTVDVYQEQVEIRILDLASIGLNSLNEYTERVLRPIQVYNFTVYESNATTLAGSQAYKVVYDLIDNEQNELKVMQIWTLKNGSIFDFTFSSLPQDYSNYLTTVQKMIDSLEIGQSLSVGAGNKNGNQSTNNSFLIYKDDEIRIGYDPRWVMQELVTDGTIRTIVFKSPFEDQSFNHPPWHEITYTMALDVDSVHDVITDYRTKISRIPFNNWTGTWSRQDLEVSAFDKTGVIEQQNNYTGFYDKRGPRIVFSFDLTKINSPEQYKIVFYIVNYFVANHTFCRYVDTTNWVIIPPPIFSMSASPTSIMLRPGEERNIELQIKGNTDLQSEAKLGASNVYPDDLNLNFIPNRTSIPASSVGTATLHLKASDNAQPKPYTLPIVANISFPTSITNRGGETFSNNRSVSVAETANLTLTVLPSYTTQEHLSNFTNAWITPITGIWTFLAGVGAVIVPVIIQLYRKRRKQ